MIYLLNDYKSIKKLFICTSPVCTCLQSWGSRPHIPTVGDKEQGRRRQNHQGKHQRSRWSWNHEKQIWKKKNKSQDVSTQTQCDIQKMENKNREKAEINTVNGPEKSSESPGETYMTGLDDSKRRNKTRQMMLSASLWERGCEAFPFVAFCFFFAEPDISLWREEKDVLSWTLLLFLSLDVCCPNWTPITVFLCFWWIWTCPNVGLGRCIRDKNSKRREDRLGGAFFVLTPRDTVPLIADLFLHVEDQVTLLFLLDFACVDRRGNDSVKAGARTGRRLTSRTRVKAHAAELLRDHRHWGLTSRARDKRCPFVGCPATANGSQARTGDWV